MGAPGDFYQVGYAFYNDDGSETTATLIGGQAIQTLEVDTIYHVRIVIEEDGTSSDVLEGGYLECSLNDSGFTTPVTVTTTSSYIQAINSTNITATNVTSARVTGVTLNGTGTFASWTNGITEAGGNPAFGDWGPYTNQFTECLLVFQIPAADVQDGDTIYIRFVSTTPAMTGYTDGGATNRYAQIDVSEATAAKRFLVIS